MTNEECVIIGVFFWQHLAIIITDDSWFSRFKMIAWYLVSWIDSSDFIEFPVIFLLIDVRHYFAWMHHVNDLFWELAISFGRTSCLAKYLTFSMSMCDMQQCLHINCHCPWVILSCIPPSWTSKLSLSFVAKLWIFSMSDSLQSVDSFVSGSCETVFWNHE